MGPASQYEHQRKLMQAAEAEEPRHSGTRMEHDLLGSLVVPSEAYYGVHTARAVANFPITGVPISIHPHLIDSLATVKQASAAANAELGLLNVSIASAIERACQDVREGWLRREFIVDVMQGGAGTSTNMNANEVIANRALEHLGCDRGRYDVVHPLDHVNLSQSTNDVYPTAVKLGLRLAIMDLTDTLQELVLALRSKSKQYELTVKMGRTQLQDAVPMTVGQELAAFAVTLHEEEARLEDAARLMSEINLGGTAIGTGLNAPRGYAEAACAHLQRVAGMDFVLAGDLVEATSDVGSFVQVSSALKRLALKLSKVCSDLRLLSSGPQAGLAELNLPAVQAGSSIMPGKVNPVIPEVVNQVAYRVIGNDLTITMAADGGQLQLNAFEPVIAHCLFESIAVLLAGMTTLRLRCVIGLTANTTALQRRGLLH